MSYMEKWGEYYIILNFKMEMVMYVIACLYYTQKVHEFLVHPCVHNKFTCMFRQMQDIFSLPSIHITALLFLRKCCILSNINTKVYPSFVAFNHNTSIGCGCDLATGIELGRIKRCHSSIYKYLPGVLCLLVTT
uniref:Uncharacterized protein n=1 Tax=Arundo donax TaxID=35708 RepID=A0A0A9H112_ARUDO